MVGASVVPPMVTSNGNLIVPIEVYTLLRRIPAQEVLNDLLDFQRTGVWKAGKAPEWAQLLAGQFHLSNASDGYVREMAWRYVLDRILNDGGNEMHGLHEQIKMFRRAALYEGEVVRAHFEHYKSFPKSRRKIAEAQVAPHGWPKPRRYRPRVRAPLPTHEAARGDGRMKALTVRQPWADLIITGRKSIEVRSWPTRYRGPMAIHAAKGPVVRDADPRLHGLPTPVNYGAIVGFANLVDCRPLTPADEEASCVAYADDRYAWILSDQRPAANIVPAKGQLSFWSPSINALLAAQGLVRVVA